MSAMPVKRRGCVKNMKSRKQVSRVGASGGWMRRPGAADGCAAGRQAAAPPEPQADQ